MPEDAGKKEAIYQATIRLIQENGLHSTPMSLIAKEANVAAGTIYLYFKNKEELLNQLYLKLKREYNDALLEGLGGQTSVRESFEHVWRNALKFQLTYTAKFSFMEQFKNSPYIFKMTIDEGLRMFQPTKNLILEAKKNKIIKNISDNILLALFFAPIGELVKQHLRAGTTPAEKEIQEAFQGCWDAIEK